MKRKGFALKCCQKSGQTIAHLVKGRKFYHSRKIVVNLEGDETEPKTVRVLRPIQFHAIGREMPRYPKMGWFNSQRYEIKSVTEKEAKELRLQGFQVHLLGPVENFNSYSSIINAVKRNTTLKGFRRQRIIDTICRRGGITRRGKSIASGSRGGGIGAGGGGVGSGGGFGCGGGGGKPTGGDDPVPPMSERRFLAFILIRIKEQQENLNRLASEVRTHIHQLPEEDWEEEETVNPSCKSVFNEYIKEDHMADALFEVYEHYRKNNLFNKELKPIDLIAYLFVMVDTFGYGRLDFRSNGQKPFFDYFMKKVVPDMENTRGNTRESMGNRLRGKMKCLYPNTKPLNQLSPNKRLEVIKTKNEFFDVCGNFHKTKYGAFLKRKLGK